MLFDEKFRKLRASFSRDAPTAPAQHPNGGLDSKLAALSIANLLAPTDARASAAPHAPARSVNLEDLFVTQTWHRPYAEALLETDPSNLPYLIAAAERAIMDRYLQLEIAPVPTDELVDLGHAIEALSQIKRANIPQE